MDTDFEIPDGLRQATDEFWNTNPSLKHQILRDVYARGRVSQDTNLMARAAVDVWLKRHAP